MKTYYLIAICAYVSHAKKIVHFKDLSQDLASLETTERSHVKDKELAVKHKATKLT